MTAWTEGAYFLCAQAFRGVEAIPAQWVETEESVNQLGLEDLASQLCDLALEL